MALTNPLKLVMALRRQHDQDAEDRQRVQQHAADRRADDGERDVALRVVISSPALLGSSNPTKLNSSTPTSSTKPPSMGL